MLWELGEFEGWRARRWPLGALGLMVAVWAPAFAAGVGSFYLGESSDSFPVVAVSVGATLTFGGLASAWSSRRPWRRLIEGRLLAYAAQLDTPPTPDDYAGALIGVEDFSRAMHALRWSGLNATGRSASAYPGASSTSSMLSVFRPAICVQPGQESVSDQTRRVLQQAGIAAEVHGTRGGRPIAGTVMRFEMPSAGASTPQAEAPPRDPAACRRARHRRVGRNRRPACWCSPSSPTRW